MRKVGRIVKIIAKKSATFPAPLCPACNVIQVQIQVKKLFIALVADNSLRRRERAVKESHEGPLLLGVVYGEK